VCYTTTSGPCQCSVKRSWFDAHLKAWPQKFVNSQRNSLGLELELIQTHMALEPMLQVEVGARALCVARAVSVERGGIGERGQFP